MSTLLEIWKFDDYTTSFLKKDTNAVDSIFSFAFGFYTFELNKISELIHLIPQTIKHSRPCNFLEHSVCVSEIIRPVSIRWAFLLGFKPFKMLPLAPKPIRLDQWRVRAGLFLVLVPPRVNTVCRHVPRCVWPIVTCVPNWLVFQVT